MSDCIFCKIVAGESPADIVYEDEHVLVFKDIKPHAPVHLLIVPRKHIRSVNDIIEEDRQLMAHMIYVGRKMAREQGVDKEGYNLLFNVERGGGQVVFHIHMHLMGGYKR